MRLSRGRSVLAQGVLLLAGSCSLLAMEPPLPPGDLPGVQLTLEQIEEQIKAQCGTVAPCAEFDRQFLCITELIHTMAEGGAVSSADKEKILERTANHRIYCDGFLNGLEAGGNCQPPPPPPRPAPPGDDDGVDKPDEPGDGDPDEDEDIDEGEDETLSEEEAKAALAEACSCEGSRNHGQYVSCVSNFLKDLVEEELLAKEDARSLHREAAQSQCGKKDKDKGKNRSNKENDNKEKDNKEKDKSRGKR